MKKSIVKIILAVLFVFSIVGFIATNSNIFKGKSDSSDNENENSGISESQVSEENFYKAFSYLEPDVFLSHQVGEIGDEIHYFGTSRKESAECWIKVESYEISKELTDQLVELSESNHSNAITEVLKDNHEDKLDLSEGKYSILKVRFRASNRDINDLYAECKYVASRYMLHAYEERDIRIEATLVDTGNLLFERFGELVDYNTSSFVFKNPEDNYFDLIYLVPDSMLENYNFFISRYNLDNYLEDTWRYKNEDWVINLNMDKENVDAKK